MLVLTRRIGEEIIIGENIRITVVAVQGERVRIGIEAPKSVAVDRKEVRDRRIRDYLDGEQEPESRSTLPELSRLVAAGLGAERTGEA